MISVSPLVNLFRTPPPALPMIWQETSNLFGEPLSRALSGYATTNPIHVGVLCQDTEGELREYVLTFTHDAVTIAQTSGDVWPRINSDFNNSFTLDGQAADLVTIFNGLLIVMSVLQ